MHAITTALSALSALADSVRISRTGAIRIHLGRVRIYIDREEVVVWEAGAPAIASRLPLAGTAAETEAAPAPQLEAVDALDAILSEPVPAPVARRRRRRPVWRTYPRPSAVRLAGVA